MKIGVKDLKPGDHLLYGPSGFFGYGIAVKTFNKVSHCECFIGQEDEANRAGYSVASRDGIGVNRYPLRTSKLYYVLRPNQSFDLVKALAWFNTVKGQKYDWLGLVRFFTWGAVGGLDKNNAQFCSEFLIRFDRNGDFHPISKLIDADSVAPASFRYSTCFDCYEFDQPKS